MPRYGRNDQAWCIQKGKDSEIDLSIGYYSKLKEFLNQRSEGRCSI